MEKTIKDETTEEIVKVKYNHLSIPVMYYLWTTPSTERACKDIL